MNSLKVNKKSAYALLGLFFALLYAYFISQHVFFWRYASDSSDIHNYVQNFDRLNTTLYYQLNSLLDFINREVLFHYIYQSLAYFIGDALVALQLISAVSIFLAAYSVFPRFSSSLPFLVFAFHPRLLDLFSSQQRFALAISIFVFLFTANLKLLRIPLLASLTSIHTFFVVYFSMSILFSLCLRKTSILTKYFTLLVLALVFVFARDIILLALGDRRAEAVGDASVGFLYLTMFIGTYFAILINNKNIVDDLFGLLFVFTAMLAVFSAFAGLYSERFVSASIIFFLAFAADNKVQGSRTIAIILFINTLLSYYFWLKNI